jgi:hypothetical protein
MRRVRERAETIRKNPWIEGLIDWLGWQTFIVVLLLLVPIAAHSLWTSSKADLLDVTLAMFFVLGSFVDDRTRHLRERLEHAEDALCHLRNELLDGVWPGVQQMPVKLRIELLEAESRRRLEHIQDTLDRIKEKQGAD